MNTIFVALLAGAMAIFATLSIERFGGKLGGLLSSIPTTAIPASLGFLWHAKDYTAAENALSVVPLGMLVNVIFLYLWRVLPSRLPENQSLWMRLGLMSIVSLSIWAFCALGLVTLLNTISPEHILTAGLTGQIVMIIFGIWACQRQVPAPKGNRSVKLSVLLSRGLLAGGAIGASAWIASLGYPILAGMASVFPAIFLTTMVSIWLAQGEAVQAGAVGPMMLGSSSVGAYALLCIWTFPMGAMAGSMLAWGIAVGFTSLPAWWWLERR